MGLIAISGFVVTGPGGTFTDRYGARAILLGGLVAMIVGNVLLAFATTPGVAAVALVLIGINFGVSWPAFNALIAAVVSGDLRQQYFGVNFALVNLGIGVGGIVGGLYVDVGEPGTFTAIFLADAASALIPMALLLGPLRHVHGRAEQPEGATGGTYLEILRQPAVRWLTGAHVRRRVRRLRPVRGRLPRLRAPGGGGLDPHDRSRVRGQHRGHRAAPVPRAVADQRAPPHPRDGRDGPGVGGSPGCSSAPPGWFPARRSPPSACWCSWRVFAFGETLMQPTIPAVSNDLAADHTRGRYNAINAAAFQGGAILGPIAAGLLLDHGLADGLHRRHGRRLPLHLRDGDGAGAPDPGHGQRRRGARRGGRDPGGSGTRVDSRRHETDEEIWGRRDLTNNM